MHKKKQKTNSIKQSSKCKQQKNIRANIKWLFSINDELKIFQRISKLMHKRAWHKLTKKGTFNMAWSYWEDLQKSSNKSASENPTYWVITLLYVYIL